MNIMELSIAVITWRSIGLSLPTSTHAKNVLFDLQFSILPPEFVKLPFQFLLTKTIDPHVENPR